MGILYGIYACKCAKCGKIFDLRKGEYWVTIPGDELIRSTCSLECAINYKQMIIEKKKNEYLKVKDETKIEKVEYREGEK